MTVVLVKPFRNTGGRPLRALDLCPPLEEPQLQLAAPGTYGTIAATLQHLLAAEQRYVRRLLGSEPRLSEKDEFPGVARLSEHAMRSGDDLIEAAGVDPDASTPAVDLRVKHWVGMAQAIHHGHDHPTQICTILGQNGISCGEMDVWAYGKAGGGYETC